MPSKGRFNGSRNSLASSFDRKVEALVRRFAEEKSREENITTQRSLRLPLAQIYQYVQSADPSFQRMKKPQLEKSVDKALAVLNAEEEEDEQDASFDSDFEGLQEETLMEVKVGYISKAQFKEQYDSTFSWLMQLGNQFCKQKNCRFVELK